MSRSHTMSVALICGALAAFGCGVEKPIGTMPVVESTVPQMPTPMPGQATLAGTVRNAAGTPVAGATVRVAETDTTATTDASGAYALAVPSDSTLTIVTKADGYASTYRESVVLASQATITGFDVSLMAPADVAADNALAGSSKPSAFGVVALVLHSLAPACATAGAHLSVFPAGAATVMYSRPSATGALDAPDRAVDGVQEGARVGAWLLGVVPPGNMLTLTVSQPGCQLLASSPSMNGMTFTGSMRSDAQALTEVDLFLDQQH